MFTAIGGAYYDAGGSEATAGDRSPGPSPSTDDPTAASGSEAADVPLDVVYEMLSNERRRRVMRYLLDRSGSGRTTLGDLAEHIAAIENDKPEAALSSAERKRLYICLYQCHLPKMDDADVVDFDDRRKTVELGENADHVMGFLPGTTGRGAIRGTGGSRAAATVAGAARSISGWFRNDG